MGAHDPRGLSGTDRRTPVAAGASADWQERASPPGKFNVEPCPPTTTTPLSHAFAVLSRSMGVLADVSGPIGNFTANSSTPVVIAAGFASFLVLAVVLNVLQQLLLKNPNEPPVVFHLFPVIGSTITYGMDPYKFFFAQQKKVCRVPHGQHDQRADWQ
jgi:hypothetical protein